MMIELPYPFSDWERLQNRAQDIGPRTLSDLQSGIQETREQAAAIVARMRGLSKPSEDEVSSLLGSFTAGSGQTAASSGYGYALHIVSPIADREKQYRERIDELVVCAAEEHVSVSESSLGDIVAFLPTLSQVGRLGIFVLENGNFRAIHKNAVDDQVGLEFLGNHTIRMTIIRRDLVSKRMVAESKDLESSYVPERFFRRQFLS